MSAEQDLRDGDPRAALRQLQEQVRESPSDSKLRVFLFQLLAVLGQWDRAMAQLNVAGELDAGALAMVQTYRTALECEGLRAGIFEGRHSPLVLGQPPQWVALMTEALRVAGQGRHAEAERLRGEAFEAAPATSGTIDGERFEWIADADARLGPLLEALVNGRYYWVPFERIHRLQIEAPADLRDLVWMPAHFAWSNGGEAFGLIPTRYPGSESSDDGLLQLARKTEWHAQDNGQETVRGQRLLTTDAGEYPLMDVREITLDTLEAAAGEAEPEIPAAPDPGDG